MERDTAASCQCARDIAVGFKQLPTWGSRKGTSNVDAPPKTINSEVIVLDTTVQL